MEDKEELELKDGEEVVDEVHEVEEHSPDDPDYAKGELEKAVAKGYDPSDEKGLSPGEFNRNQSFFNKIKALKIEKTKEVSALKKQIDALANQVSAAERRGFDEAMKQLDAQRREAVRYGNVEEFDAVNVKMEELKAHTAAVSTNNLPLELQEFQERNKEWVNGDTAKGRVIYDKVQDFVKHLPSSLSLADKISQIEEYVDLTYPNRGADVKAKASKVAAGASPSMKKANHGTSIDELPEFYRARYEVIKKQNPSYTVDQYVTAINGRFK